MLITLKNLIGCFLAEGADPWRPGTKRRNGKNIILASFGVTLRAYHDMFERNDENR